MRAIAVSEYRADARLVDLDKPSAGPGQVLLKVDAAGMNPMDRAIADGAFSEVFPATFPLIMGVDVVGVVEAVGDGAGAYAIGDRVFGKLLSPPLGASGSYADYAAVPADSSVATVPEKLSNEIAVTLPTPGVTALQLARSLEPAVGKTVAVVGAGGAVGGFLTQLLVASGARVLAVVWPRQADRVRSYGAHERSSTPRRWRMEFTERLQTGSMSWWTWLVTPSSSRCVPTRSVLTARRFRRDTWATSTRLPRRTLLVSISSCRRQLLICRPSRHLRQQANSFLPLFVAFDWRTCRICSTANQRSLTAKPLFDPTHRDSRIGAACSATKRVGGTRSTSFVRSKEVE